jgi:hypothetical protein
MYSQYRFELPIDKETFRQLNKDKKISEYEKKRGKAIEDSIAKKDGKGLTAAQKKLPEGLRKAIEAKKKK